MILKCPKCETRYETPGELPSAGCKVRCASCQHVWHATEAEPPEEPSTEPGFDAEEVIFQDPVIEAGAEQDSAPAPEPETASAPEAVFEAVEDAGEAATGERPEPAAESTAESAGTEEAGDDFSEQAMEEAFSSAIQEAQAAQAGEGAGESPPIVIGKARKRGGAGIGNVRVAAGWAGLALMLAGVAAGAYFQRVDVVRALPGAASAYARIGLPVNVRGLAFENVEYSWEESAGRPVLEVSGDIVNVTAHPLKVPTVVFGLRTKEKVEVYQWAADVRSELLPAGARTAFKAQIPSPPKSIRDVQVRFAKVR